VKAVFEVENCDSEDDKQFVCCSCTLLIMAKLHSDRMSERTTKEVFSYAYIT